MWRKKLQPFMELIERAGNSTDTLELIRVIDELYNRLMDPNFESMHGTLEQVLAVTMEDLTEYSWEDFLSEEMYEEVLESYAEQLTNSVSGLEILQLQKKWKKTSKKQFGQSSYSGDVGESLHICGIKLWKVLFK